MNTKDKINGLVNESMSELFVAFKLIKDLTQPFNKMEAFNLGIIDKKGKKLKEPLVVRPTSETIMYEMYSKWINSWRDLPMKINQWNNVVRWEKRTYLFLRTLEFLWQEGHTVHATEAEAIKMQEAALEWYRQIYEDYYAIPAVIGEKSAIERFAGAKTTYTVEALMPDGKALQGATSHNLGQNFSKPFNISFQDRDGKTKFAWQTSWGLSTRSMGGLFLTHGDDNGLIMPPKIAPIQVVIIPIINSEETIVSEFVSKVEKELTGADVRVKVDDREDQTIGRKFNHWEIKGVPLRFEVGGREVEKGVVTVVRRDNGGKKEIGFADLKKGVPKLLDEIQQSMFDSAKKYLKDNTCEVKDYEEFKVVMAKGRGLIKVYWEEDTEDEKKIKRETKATTRCKVMDNKTKGKCFMTGKETNQLWYFAQAY